MKQISKNIAVGGLLFLAGCGASYLFTSKYYENKYRDDLQFAGQFSTLKNVSEFVAEHEYLSYDASKAETFAVKSYVENLGDRYAEYITGNEFDEIYVNTSNTLKASGYRIEENDDGNIRIKYVEAGSAADQQGLREGDVITAIDGVSVAETGYYNIINELLGKDETEVGLSISRGGESVDVNFVRRNIYYEQEQYETKELGNGVGYIRLAQFNMNTAGVFSDYVSGDFSGLVIDLRDCAGGYVEYTVDCMNKIIETDSKVTLVDVNGSERIYNIVPAENAVDCPVVILTNEETISSAEIFVEIFKETGRGTVVGTQTYGKQVYQDTTLLDNGDWLKLTSGKNVYESGADYHEKGIAPDIEVEMDSELIGTDDDIQLAKALELLS